MKSPMVAGSEYSASDCGTRQRSKAGLCLEPSAKPSNTALRSAVQAVLPSCIKSLSAGRAPAATARMRRVVDRADPGQQAEIQHLVPDRDAASKRLAGASPAEHRQRQVLNRKIALRSVRGRHPAPASRIVGLIEGHGASRAAWSLRAESDRNACSNPASSSRSPFAEAAGLRAHSAWAGSRCGSRT